MLNRLEEVSDNVYKLVGVLYEVHRELGPGLNEYVYQEGLKRELELQGIEMSRNEIYRIEHNQMIVKDFELVAFCIVLDINFNDIKDYFEQNL